MNILKDTRASVMAEACIGLALLSFAWIFISFTFYIRNNQIRTVMAARHVAWTLGQGSGAPSAADLASGFGFDNANLVKLDPAPNEFGLIYTYMDVGSLPFGSLAGGNNAWMATVSYGMRWSDVASTTVYPFTLINMHVPFMPASTQDNNRYSTSLMDNYTYVQAKCAWPANVNDQWQSAGEAMQQALAAIFGAVSGAIGGLIQWLGNLFS